jgi:hypothetical protein
MDAVFFTNKKYQKKKIMVATKAIGITGALLRLINCSLISYSNSSFISSAGMSPAFAGNGRSGSSYKTNI